MPRPPLATISGFSLPLEWRAAFLFALLTSLTLGAAVAVAFMQGRSAAMDAVGQDLARSAQIESELARRRLEEVQLKAQLIAVDPDFVEYIADAQRIDLAPGNSPEGAASITDLLLERQQSYVFDLGMVLDRNGAVLARTDQREMLQQTLRGDAFIARALRDLTAVSGFWRRGQQLYQAALIPLAKRDELVGYLVVALKVNSDFAASIGKGSGVDVLFLLPDRNSPGIVGASLDAAQIEMARAAISAGAGGIRSAVNAGRLQDRLQLAFANQSWSARLEPLDPEAGPMLGSVLLLSSSDRAFSGHLRLLNVMATVALGVLLFAIPASVLLAKATLRPVAAIAAAAQEAAAGNYKTRVAMRGNDELAKLSRAIDSLLADLHEKEEMEGFAADLWRHLPEPGHVKTDATPIHMSGVPGASCRSTKMCFAPGAMLGDRYQLITELGAGGMGVVYKAVDLELDEVVAIKVLKPTMFPEGEHLGRLKDEIRLARRITHPNVIRTFDYGESQGVPYISMEYVRGMTLRYLLERTGRVPYSVSLRIARQLCAALAAAHEVGVLHRDIKPENVILEQSANAKLMDFGIASTIHGAKKAGDLGMFVGSAQYASPETLAGEVVDQRSDVYSLGVMLCEMVSGQQPFANADTMQIYLAQMKEDVIGTMRWPSGMPHALESLLSKCLARNPEMRFQRASELSEAIMKLRG